MTLQLFVGDECLWTQILEDPKTNMPLNKTVLVRAKAGQTLKASVAKKKFLFDNVKKHMFVVEPKVRGLWWHGQVTVLGVKNEESVVVGSYTWVAAEPVVSGAWCLKSTEKKDPMDDECPVILADFKPVALPGAQSTMVSGVRSWQMVGSAPVEEVRTNVTKEDQTNINGPKATPTDVALADVKAGLLAGSRSSVSAAGAASPSAKKANKPKECEEDDGINFFDSVSQVGALGLGGYKAHKGMLHQAAPSNLTEASSVPPSVAKKACDIHTVNLNALVARFLVDMRMFEWQPQSVEEYLAIGQLPQGLQLNGQATINGLALGFDNTGSVMDYDREPQIYTNATWSRHLVKATAVDYILDPFKNNCWSNSLWKNMLLCFFHAIIFHPSRSQLELASACEKGLRFVHEKLVGANLLQPQVVLGLRIAERWVKLVIEKEMAYGPCLAMWVCQRIKLIQKKRVMRSGMEITELLPEGDESANFYQHGNQYLHMIKTALLEANVWQGAGQRSLVREAPTTPTTEAQEMAGCNKEIELSNCQLLQTCFERTSLLPGTAGCRLNLRKGTRPMFTLPGLLGGCRYVISNGPHVFLANGALGLSTVTLHQSKAGGLLWMGCTTSSWLTLPLVAPWKQSVGTSVG